MLNTYRCHVHIMFVLITLAATPTDLVLGLRLANSLSCTTKQNTYVLEQKMTMPF